MRRFALALFIVALSFLAIACASGGSGGSGSTDAGGALDFHTGDTVSITDSGRGVDDTLGDSGGSSVPQSVVSPPTPPTTKCPKSLPPAASGTCGVVAGSAVRVIRGTVIAPDQVFAGGEIVIDAQGKIACVGCDCTSTEGYAGATTLECADGVISPGLINTHDHITFAHNAPKSHAAKYDHRHEWRKGLNGKPAIKVPGAPNAASNAVVSWGELRFAVGGATSTIGSGGVNGMLRNLDRNEPMQGGLGKKAVTFETFPLGDSTPQKTLPESCTYKLKVKDATVTGLKSFLPHLSEGVNLSARNEFDCTDGVEAQANYDYPQTAIIHAVGLQAIDAALAAKGGVSVIWSPRSNIDLYGFTANVTMYARMGMNIALGTDWSASGSMNMLRELACADGFNQANLGGVFSDYALYRMVTENAAKAAKMDDVIGQLGVGRPADVTIFASKGKTPYAAVIRAGIQDVALVLRAGAPLHGDGSLVDGLSSDGGTGCEALEECLAGKKLCAKREFGKTTDELKTTIGGSPYALYVCGTPDPEPSCVPSRDGQFTGVPSADDSDGDGIANGEDLCPTTFSAIRPMDGGKQQDIDGDGAGDACDPCPLAAGSEDCAQGTVTLPIPSPVGTIDAGGGTVDAGPTDAGPPKPATILEAQNLPDGTNVQFDNVCVVAVRVATAGTTIWVQDPTVTEHGGFVVYSKQPVTVKAGDEIDATGIISTFKGLREIINPTVTVSGECSTSIQPILVNPADIATGGAKMAALMGMLVEVDDVSVTAAAVKPTDDFVVTGGLRVSPFIFAFDATKYTVGMPLAIVRGVLDYFTDHSKISPLDAEDIVTQ